MFALIFCSRAMAIDWQKIESHAMQEQLYQQEQWLRLGHYRCGVFGCKSEQDGDLFFASPAGMSDPKSEMVALFAALKTNQLRQGSEHHPAQTALCQYPARVHWLLASTDTNIPPDLFKTCTEFQEFYQRLDSTAVSMVFSSYYLNNPSSVFGHTLIKIHRKAAQAHGQNADLLNYGVNYAANPTTELPVVYALMGLLGGFDGTFTAMPYYYKVREYNDFETRDLWEYELNLTTEQREQMIRHLWELGSAYFDYYYLSENCSYHLLALLEVAQPQLNIVEPLPYWVIPSDTIKSIASEQSFVKSINFRPSLSRQLASRYGKLSNEQRKNYHQAIKKFETKNLELDALTLDAVIDQFDIVYGRELIHKDKTAVAQKHELLLQRSQLGDAPKLQVLRPAAPHEAHESLRVYFAGGELNKRSAIVFENRFAFHDLVDPIVAMPKPARIEMFQAELQYLQDENKLRLGRIRLAGVEALNPWSSLWQKPAWRFDMGGERITDERCNDCWAGLTGGSGGFAASFNFLKLEWVPFVYANLRLRMGEFVEDDFSLEYGPSIGLRILGPYDLNLLVEVEERYFKVFESVHHQIFTGTLQKSMGTEYGLRLQFVESDFKQDYKIGFVGFF